MKVKGKVWCFGDNVDTDQIIATQYYILADPKEMAKHTLEVVMPSFAASVQAGDIVVGGKNFGCGSSREQAVSVFKTLGIGAIIAESFARIFYRNCINVGLPLIESKGITAEIKTGDLVEIDIREGTVRNLNTEKEYQGIKLPDFLMEIIEEGGLVEHDLRKGV